MSGRVTRALLAALVVVAVLVGTGAVAGLVWVWVWEPPTGLVHEGAWYLLPSAADDAFSATGWYVLLAFGASLVVSTGLCWLVRRDELVVLGAVALGSVVAGWVMLQVGQALGPPDPDVLARTAEQGTRLPAELTLGGDDGPAVLDTSAMTAFPGGALVGLTVAFLFRGPRQESATGSRDSPPEAALGR